MQPQPGQQPQPQSVIMGQPAQFAGGVADPYQGQVVVMSGPPSGAAKVVGILLMVYGGITLVGGLLSAVGGPAMNAYFGEALGSEYSEYALPDWTYIVQGLFGILAGAGYLYSGWLLQSFQRKGIHYAWGILAISWVFGIIISAFMPTPAVEGVEEGALEMMNVGTTAICGLFSAGICGVLVAIPMFMNNNGLE